MFGYVTPDKPNMYMKDYTLYRAFYCGICKSTGKMFGQFMRFSTNYDITFFSILLHNILDEKVEIVNETCILNPFFKKSVVKSDRILRMSVFINVLLLDFKLNDDIRDSGSFRKRAAKFFMRRKIKRAAREYPEIYKRIQDARAEQNKVEESGTPSVDMAAHPFASLLRDIFRMLSGDKFTDYLGRLIYQLGRFIYFSDALDDFDKDKESGEFNPLIKAYPEIKKRCELFDRHRDDMEYMLKSAYNEIKRNYEMTDFKVSEGVVTNILWYGLKVSIDKFLTGGVKGNGSERAV